MLFKFGIDLFVSKVLIRIIYFSRMFSFYFVFPIPIVLENEYACRWMHLPISKSLFGKMMDKILRFFYRVGKLTHLLVIKQCISACVKSNCQSRNSRSLNHHLLFRVLYLGNQSTITTLNHYFLSIIILFFLIKPFLLKTRFKISINFLLKVFQCGKFQWSSCSF
ncbi:MAG: hypothetical protein [Siphoviridae sp. cttb18]|nr:MAG: hypothetical protein [Siphoviridae sp. cttb18]